jgi:hypothetical protein
MGVTISAGYINIGEVISFVFSKPLQETKWEIATALQRPMLGLR